MSPATQDDWNFEDDFFCAHCLTELEKWDTRCYRCNHSFYGTGRFDLLNGKPHIAAVLHRG